MQLFFPRKNTMPCPLHVARAWCTAYPISPPTTLRQATPSPRRKNWGQNWGSAPGAALRAELEQVTSIVDELLSSVNLVPVRFSFARIKATLPRCVPHLLCLSISRSKHHPCNPGAHMELPWRAADAVCLLPARRLLRHLRPEGRPDHSRAPHGIAGAQRARCGAWRRDVT